MAKVVKAKPKPDHAKQALGAIARKVKQTPLENALQVKGGARMIQLVRFARQQWMAYQGKLATWYAKRKRYSEEARDCFDARRKVRESERDETSDKPVFQILNDSLNITAAMSEFASAQADQDLFGGEPWFAAKPVGKLDQELADTIQRHFQWTLRDGKMVATMSEGIDIAVALGESFDRVYYDQCVEEYERAETVLHLNGKPIETAEGYITADMGDAKAHEAAQALGLKGKFSWGDVYVTENVTISNGVKTCPVAYHDIAFREDARELDLRETNVYIRSELSLSDAMKRFNLSRLDALRLAESSGISRAKAHATDPYADSYDNNPSGGMDEFLMGMDMDEELMNSRVQVIEAFQRLDPLGDGKQRSIYTVFSAHEVDWLIYANYLGAISPKATLPVFVRTWEKVKHKLFGRGFFEKYEAYQNFIDNQWNQVAFRNAMTANPITGVDRSKLDEEDDETDLEIKPTLSLNLKPNARLSDALQFAALPDLDNRSIELMQTMIQIMQLRSGITSASQGDMAGLPENNTATGIRQLMSRAAVLLKKPIRNLRRGFSPELSYAVKLHYANFDREEAFVWGEGENQQLLTISADQVRNLDIDVQMLLTQEQNQTKLEGAQAASGLFMQWLSVPEIEKSAARPFFLQAMKALEFAQSDDIIREAAPTLADAITLLPKQEQANAIAVMQAGEQALAATAAPTVQQPQTEQPQDQIPQ